MSETATNHGRTFGFTLIELSIVLVIIGLIVGGVLVGQDLIQAASIRSQISQIEKFNTASNTFRLKHNCLPGDCELWQQFGLEARSSQGINATGNRLIEGCSTDLVVEVQCEAALFWRDLSQASLIDGSFNTATDGPVGVAIPAEDIKLYLPNAKVGNNKYVSVYGTPLQGLGLNYWFITGISEVNPFPITSPGLGVSPIQAHAIDSKIDDAMPLTGNVVVGYAGSLPTTVTYQDGGLLGCDTENNSYSDASSYILSGEHANSPDCWLRIRASF